MRGFLAALLLLATLPAAALQERDDRGVQIELAAPARRIASLAPHITESLFAVGAGSAVAATANHSDHPPAARALPRLGPYNAIAAEAVAAVAPDLVIAWGEGNEPNLIRRLESLGIPVYVTDPATLGDIPRTLEAFGRLTGHAREAKRAAQSFRRRLAELERRHRGKRPVVVFYQVWDRPLLTASDRTLIGDVIRLCGGVNPFGAAAPRYPVVSVEAVLAADPEVIVASGMGDDRPEWLDRWRRWPLRAVRRGLLFFVPSDLLQRHSVRVLEGADRLCAALEAARQDGALSSVKSPPRPYN
ncbi:MAG: cobalamin-binding protein [Porticoccaceae bacterium]|nr:MAG: cobalamin-binding protein [Porticoccaceae bacterium]